MHGFAKLQRAEGELASNTDRICRPYAAVGYSALVMMRRIFFFSNRSVKPTMMPRVKGLKGQKKSISVSRCQFSNQKRMNKLYVTRFSDLHVDGNKKKTNAEFCISWNALPMIKMQPHP